MAEEERRASSSTRLELWGGVLALCVLAAFLATFGVALLPRPASNDTADDGPGDPRGSYSAEQAVDAWHANRWYPAHVHSRAADRYFITYDDFSISWHEWVGARRLRPR